MSNRNAAIIRSLYDSIRNGDIDAVLGAMDSNVQWNVAENFPYADGKPFVGPQAVLEGVFARVPAEWEDFAHYPDKFVADGDTVVVLGRYRAISKMTGRPVDAQMVHVWGLRDGKIVRFQQYTDTAQWRDAVRL
jgi:ketosteroid isomerase-like protein